MTNTPPVDMATFIAQMEAAGHHFTGTLIDRMGIEMLDVRPDYCAARMPVAGNTQPYGLLHGGASAAIAETVGSFAAAMHAGEGRIAVGIELNATHHRSASEGWVVAEARALHLGRTLATYEVTVRAEADDGEGPRLCTARLTCLIR